MESFIKCGYISHKGMGEADFLIVGAGPSGLAAADSLSKKGYSVILLDQGSSIDHRICKNASVDRSKCTNCQPCNIHSGFGGAGGKSDGKLNLNPYIGKNLLNLIEGNSIEDKEKTAYDYIHKVDQFFIDCGAPIELKSKADDPRAKELAKKARKLGLDYMLIDQKHIGSDKLIQVMKNMYARLQSQTVNIILRKEIADIIFDNGSCLGVVLKDKSEIKAKHVLLGLGRRGEEFLKFLGKKYSLSLLPSPVDIGVRVETLNEVMEDLTSVTYDPKIRCGFWRTFCTNPSGFVVREQGDKFVTVNGHAEANRKSINTNFALLCTIELEKPKSDTYDYAALIAGLCSNAGGKKPLVQTIARFMEPRPHRSTIEEIFRYKGIRPTLTDVTPGNLFKVLTGEIFYGIRDAMEKLEELAPGLCKEHNTLMYAPEIKFNAYLPKLDSCFQSEINNLFFIGDVSGRTGSIVTAAAMGFILADKF
ncbi:NAD(P)/FAD-dependent oxidoreductase [Candidatus Woesearchaeota archaeon]|nr:NAD(P)/FAD-dependent oxidoreductase [Candidatus Woesearchaeota archaeon]